MQLMASPSYKTSFEQTYSCTE